MLDVFIGHASEDQDSFVRPLAIELNAHGVSVGYDEFVLKAGDNLRLTVDWGLQEARFGVVILSPAFFALAWPERDLDGLATRGAKLDGGLILPVWNKVEARDIYRFSLALADKSPIKAVGGGDAAAKGILDVLRPDLTAKAKAAASQLQAAKAAAVVPYTLGTLYDFLTRYDGTFDWGPHLGVIYQAHRQLALSTINQLREAIADRDIEDALDRLHRKLLGRPLDLVGKIVHMPLAFLMGDQGQRLVESSLMASQDYAEHRVRHRPDVAAPPDDFTRDPVTMAGELPPGWEGDAWIKNDESECFVRAWNRRNGHSAVGRGSTFKSARYLLLHKIQDLAPGWSPSGTQPAKKKQA